MNVLLTSVGRRAYMVRFFKEAVGKKGEVHVCNSDEKSVAFCYADKKVVSPLIYDKNYIPFLLNYCQKNHIDILLSLFDIDLLILAKNKNRFAEIGTRVIVSNEDLVGICNDKWKTYIFLKEHNFFVPRTYLNEETIKEALQEGEITFPIVVKPRFGCGSLSVAIAYDLEDLKYLTKKIKREISSSYLKYESAFTDDNVIYQEHLNGQEYGADIINDLNGHVRGVVIREKIAMRSGETDIARLVEDSTLKKELLRLGKITGHIANMDCDIFMVAGKPYILELNARFGGGYPFSHMAGCNLPLAIVKWAQGEMVEDDIIVAQTDLIGYKEILITKGSK